MIGGSFIAIGVPDRNQMGLSGSGVERDVDDAAPEFDQHVVAQLTVIEAVVLTGHDEAAIERLMQIGEILAMASEIDLLLGVVPRAGFTHPWRLSI
jgi:hypothetical protein